MLEAHYGARFAGAVLVALNHRLSPGELAYIIDHSNSRALIYDHEMREAVREIAKQASVGLRLVEAGGAGRHPSIGQAVIAFSCRHHGPKHLPNRVEKSAGRLQSNQPIALSSLHGVLV